VLALPNAAPRNGELILGVRPEHQDVDPAGLWPLHVEMVEMLGAERIVYGRLGGELITVRIDGTHVPPKLKDAVRLRVSAEHLHWFDAASGKRVD
jgi:sn-glycerol 3-phosphate transport system ATP-binding protein